MEKKKRTRRSKAEIEAAKKQQTSKEVIDELIEYLDAVGEYKNPKGLGDTVEKITEVTGIKKVTKWLMGEDCGCDKRKEILNKWFPYKKPNCLTEEEYEYLKYFFMTVKNTVTIKHQRELLKIYNRVFNQNQQMTSCTQCWKERVGDLKKVYLEYEKN